jgi:hypothetical protein
VTATRQQEPTLGGPISRNLGFVTGPIWATFRYDLPAQPVDATPSNQLIRQYFLYRIDLYGRTLASRSQYSDQFEIEEVFGSWLRKTIATLEEAREGSPRGPSFCTWVWRGGRRISVSAIAPELREPRLSYCFSLAGRR